MVESKQVIAQGIPAVCCGDWRYPVGMEMSCLRLHDSSLAGKILQNWNMKPIMLTPPKSWIV